VKIWDVEAQSEAYSFEDFTDTPFHADWNKTGSQIVVSSKDKHIYFYDPRDHKTVAKLNGFQGPKKSSVFFTDKVQNGVVGVGFNNKGGRSLMVWDTRKAEHVHSVDFDQSPGVVVAHMDNDNGVLYLVGKGDVGVSFFEVNGEPPHLHYLDKSVEGRTAMGAAFLPKRHCDVTKCEIALIYKLVDGAVVPTSFQVPRKSELFQKDLFPECYAGVHSCSHGEWKSGKVADPVLVSLDPKQKGKGEAHAAAHAAASLVAKKSYAELEAEVEALKKKVAELEGQLAAKS